MEYLFHTLNLALIYVILTVSLNLILGYGGMASMAHAAFFCIGGYVRRLFPCISDLTSWLGYLGSIVITAVVGGSWPLLS